VAAGRAAEVAGRAAGAARRLPERSCDHWRHPHPTPTQTPTHPQFVDADKAAANLAALPEFQSARVVKCNPDTPSKPVRAAVLSSGRKLLAPQPRLRTGARCWGGDAVVGRDRASGPGATGRRPTRQAGATQATARPLAAAPADAAPRPSAPLNPLLQASSLCSTPTASRPTRCPRRRRRRAPPSTAARWGWTRPWGSRWTSSVRVLGRGGGGWGRLGAGCGRAASRRAQGPAACGRRAPTGAPPPPRPAPPRAPPPVCGSSCVSPNGARLGKGEGFAEVEYGVLRLLGAVDESTPVVTVVRACQEGGTLLASEGLRQ
jgi:5-formyltetrahydrofolate cyclo-ligase